MNSASINNLITGKITGEWGKEPTSDGVKVIRTTNFRNDGMLDLTNVVVRDIPKVVIQKKRLLSGDIIIEKSGGSPAQPVGRVVYFDVPINSEVYLCNNFTSILRPSEKINSKYLFLALYYLHSTKRTLKYQNKTTGIINLQLDRYIKTEKVNTPSLDEQAKIVNLIDQADNLRQKRKQAIGLLDEYLKSVFLEMFGDPVGNPKNLDVIKFGEIIDDIRYGSSRKSDDVYSSGKVPILRIPNIAKGAITYDDLQYQELPKVEKEKLQLRKSDILFVRTNGNPDYIGRCAVFEDDKEFIYASYLIRVRLKEKAGFLAEFIRFCLSMDSYKHKIRKESRTTAGNYNINTQGIRNFDLIKPSLDQQTKFLELRKSIEILKAKMFVQSSELDNQFNALMQKYFNSN
ncbi:MAG: restriction endonuclease subunit S [Patescibacteria group bacterium]|nr:restriction endonuclease subunit S [Patescibacteria group bacterium]